MADRSDALPEPPDEIAYDWAADLAEHLLEAVGSRRPDWCQIARDARLLADAAQRWCPEPSG